MAPAAPRTWGSRPHEGVLAVARRRGPPPTRPIGAAAAGFWWCSPSVRSWRPLVAVAGATALVVAVGVPARQPIPGGSVPGRRPRRLHPPPGRRWRCRAGRRRPRPGRRPEPPRRVRHKADRPGRALPTPTRITPQVWWRSWSASRSASCGTPASPTAERPSISWLMPQPSGASRYRSRRLGTRSMWVGLDSRCSALCDATPRPTTTRWCLALGSVHSICSCPVTSR